MNLARHGCWTTLEFAHMLAADSKVVCAPVVEAPHAEPPGDWRHIIGPVEPFLETVGHRLGRQVEAFDPESAHPSGFVVRVKP